MHFWNMKFLFVFFLKKKKFENVVLVLTMKCISVTQAEIQENVICITKRQLLFVCANAHACRVINKKLVVA